MPSFDIVSKVPMHEVENALQQAQKEIAQRWDFKNTDTELDRGAEGINIKSDSPEKCKAALEVFQEKMIKRKVSLKFLDIGDPVHQGKTHKILVKIKDGIDSEPARKIVLAIKEAKLKVQGSMQDAQVRVTGKNKDDLQKAMAMVRGMDLDVAVSFTNFRE